MFVGIIEANLFVILTLFEDEARNGIWTEETNSKLQSPWSSQSIVLWWHDQNIFGLTCTLFE